jgi:thiol:disulfide interchange protein DsbD
MVTRGGIAAAALAVGVVACASLGALPVSAAPAPATTVRPLADVTAAQPGQTFWIGLELTMAPGWHTYWKNPGDAGMATKVTWTLPPEVGVGPIQWPAPRRLEETGNGVTVVSFAYEDRVVLPMKATVSASAQPGTTLTLDGQVDWVECKDVCVKQRAPVRVQVLVAPEPVVNADADPVLAQARAAVPSTEPAPVLHASAKGDRLILRIEPSGTPLPTSIQFIPVERGIIDLAAPQSITRNGQALQLTLTRSPYAQQPPARLTGLLVADPGWDSDGTPQAVEIDVPVES